MRELKSPLDLIIKKSFIELKMRLKEMKISSQLKGGIYEVSFGFHSKLDGYATLMLGIPTLFEIAGDELYINRGLYLNRGGNENGECIRSICL